jgi:CheY-like chemotaxis protein
VDDEQTIREMVPRLLRRSGYVVRTAPDATAAIEILNSTCVGAILVDRNMPGHNGDWLVAQVRERFPSTAIILATGEYVPPAVSLQSGVVGHLSKPFTADAVRDALADAMVWHQVASRNVR